MKFLQTARAVVCLGAFALAGIAQTALRVGPPVLGTQTNFNRNEATPVPLLSIDFESANEDLIQSSVSISFTSAPGEVISGRYSLKLVGQRAELLLNSASLPLQPEQTYVVEYDYRILQTGESGPRVSVIFVSGDKAIDLGGPDANSPLSGHDVRGLRTPPGAAVKIGFRSSLSEVVIDNVRIYRQQTAVLSGAAPQVKLNYPKLAAFVPPGALNPNATDFTQQRDLLASFDMVLGLEADSTLGGLGAVQGLRERNRNLILLSPQSPGLAKRMAEQPVAGVAGLNALFNQGLDPRWYLRTVSGARVTLAGEDGAQLSVPQVGASDPFGDYLVNYLTDTVLASGLWDGVELRDTQWFPTSRLLVDGALPALDLSGDGRPASIEAIFGQWREGYFQLMSRLNRRTGETRLVMGSPGVFSPNPGILSLANGWTAEALLPFPVSADGNFVTDENAAWQRLVNTYFLANRFARAPQINTLQFSGAGLGIPTGKLLSSGLFERTPQLEPRDFTRMRFGLGTTLLGEGFFSYALVDKTSAVQWFDEYAVDTNGIATRALTGKGYLGQAVNDAQEIRYPVGQTAVLDFESPVENLAMVPGPIASVTSDPALVMAGKNSLLVRQDDTGAQDFFVVSLADKFPLQVGKTYTALIEYRVVEFKPTKYGAFLAFGFISPEDGWNQNRATFLSYEDIDPKNPSGLLRVAVKVKTDGVVLLGRLLDRGAVVVDNIRLLETTGGVWRRDFQRGIVLVNPTSEPQTILPDDLAGPLHRTGVKRIAGLQAPDVNSGRAVDNGLTLAPGDAIILLADKVAAPVLQTPAQLSTSPDTASVDLAWTPQGIAPAGYRIRIGEDILNLPRTVAAGQTTRTTITGLIPGTRYAAQIASCDFTSCSSYSEPVSFNTIGASKVRPYFRLAPGTFALSPGGLASLSGYELSSGYQSLNEGPLPTQIGNTLVRVNGSPVPLRSVSATQIDFVAPFSLGGTEAVVTVEREGVASAPRSVPVWTATPTLVVDSEDVLLARTAVAGREITTDKPALPGDLIEVEATGLGAVLAPPNDGRAPAGPPVSTLAPITLTVNNVQARVASATLSPSKPGYYVVRFLVPAETPPGAVDVQLRSGNQDSNVGNLLVH